MSERARLATSLLALAAIAAIVALLAIGAGSGRRAVAGCAGATDGTYLASSLTVARGINIGERIGEGVMRAVATVESDQVLASAVAADDVAAVTSEVRVLVYNHEHIVRLRVLRDGVVLDDLGGPLVLSPVRGMLRLAGRAVGTFVLSVQDYAGYRKFAERLNGADVVIRYRGAMIMSERHRACRCRPVARSPSTSSTTCVAGFTDARFPSWTLDIGLLYRAPARRPRPPQPRAGQRRRARRRRPARLRRVAERTARVPGARDAGARPGAAAGARRRRLCGRPAGGQRDRRGGGFARLRVLAAPDWSRRRRAELRRRSAAASSVTPPAGSRGPRRSPSKAPTATGSWRAR